MSRALIVGIDDYPSCRLQCCVKDAQAVAGLLARNADGSPNFAVRLETSPLKKGKLREIISSFFEAEDAISLFYFAGHGFLNEYGGYIVTPDYANYDEGISMSDILTIINDSKAIDKIVILDCCHSGNMGSKPEISHDTVVHIGKGVTILTASGSHEKALEINGHGLFTNLLLAALDGGAADLRGKITIGSIYAYIDLAMGLLGQRPSFKSNITKFVPLRTAEPPIPQATLRKLIEYFITPETEFPLDPSYEYTAKEAIPEHTVIFQDLQKHERVGLVVPVNEQFMYYAAMNSKSCKLTALGKHYWILAKENKI